MLIIVLDPEMIFVSFFSFLIFFFCNSFNKFISDHKKCNFPVENKSESQIFKCRTIIISVNSYRTQFFVILKFFYVIKYIECVECTIRINEYTSE